MASKDDAAPFELDLSLPPQPLEDTLWQLLLDRAFTMDPSELPESLVPDFDGETDTDELTLQDSSIDFLALDGDVVFDEILDADTFDFDFEDSDSDTDFPLGSPGPCVYGSRSWRCLTRTPQ